MESSSLEQSTEPFPNCATRSTRTECGTVFLLFFCCCCLFNPSGRRLGRDRSLIARRRALVTATTTTTTVTAITNHRQHEQGTKLNVLLTTRVSRWIPSGEDRRSLPQPIPRGAQTGLGPLLHRLAVLGPRVSLASSFVCSFWLLWFSADLADLADLAGSEETNETSAATQGEAVRGAEGGQIGVALHGNGAGRDQTAAVRARQRRLGPEAREDGAAARRLQDQRRQRHPRLHGLRGARPQPPQAHHPQPIPRHSAAQRQDHHPPGRPALLLT